MQYVKRLSPEFVKRYKDKVPPWGPVGYITYKRTYSRFRDDLEQKEEWYQTVERCCNGILDIGGAFLQQEIEQLYDYVFNLKCCFSGRALWQLGTKTVERIGADSLQNCWHVAINHPIDPFCFTFNQLMLGGGVGFNIMPEYVYELPVVKYGVKITRVDTYDCDLIVTDNREGWVELLRQILKAFFYTGKNFTYCTACIRPKGRVISTFGGFASGSEGLVEGISHIIKILNGRVNYKLRPIDCLDILNIIGSIVVAGNVRRSAELALGAPSDKLFLKAKDWSSVQIPNWRGMSNNSVACGHIDDLPQEFWNGYEGNGEPYGLINLDLCRSHGRLEDGPDYRSDPRVTGTNPCGELPEEPYEACNLGEVFLPNIFSVEELFNATGLIYKVCKSISCYPFSDPRVNEVVIRNHRIGVGLTGLLQSSWIQQPDSISRAYQALEELDMDYSRTLGTGRSIKLTTVKPSGTLSLLPGVTPGIHPAYAKYYVRRIRFAANDPLVDACRKNGCHIEPQINFDGSRNLDTMVVSFPIKTPDRTILAKDVTPVDQLEFQTFMQNYWSDNAVSITCYYRPEELNTIKEYLRENYTDGIKTVSFLLHKGHGFLQAPLEEITREEYNKLSEKQNNLTQLTETEDYSLLDNMECSSGACPIK